MIYTVKEYMRKNYNMPCGYTVSAALEAADLKPGDIVTVRTEFLLDCVRWAKSAYVELEKEFGVFDEGRTEDIEKKAGMLAKKAIFDVQNAYTSRGSVNENGRTLMGTTNIDPAAKVIRAYILRCRQARFAKVMCKPKNMASECLDVQRIEQQNDRIADMLERRLSHVKTRRELVRGCRSEMLQAVYQNTRREQCLSDEELSAAVDASGPRPRNWEAFA